MNNRPVFTRELSKEKFLRHYWYKTELQKICAKYNLPTLGTKAELQSYILDFLDGKTPVNVRKSSNSLRLKKSPTVITLDTKLIEDGFKFDNNARAFFADLFHMEKFSFTKEMASALREAERENNKNMCVRDLVNIYLESKKNEKSTDKELTKEDLTYQWNNFLKDFHSDPETTNLNNKMQIASFLWRHVRDTPGEKNIQENF